MLLRRQVTERLAVSRSTVAADSVNATILGPGAFPGSVLLDLAMREVIKARSVKAGQFCKNIQRMFVTENIADAFTEALAGKAHKLRIGDPQDEKVRRIPCQQRAIRRSRRQYRIVRPATDLNAASYKYRASRNHRGLCAPHEFRHGLYQH